MYVWEETADVLHFRLHRSMDYKDYLGDENRSFGSDEEETHP